MRFLGHHLRPLLDILDTLQLYIVLDDILLPGEFFLFLFIHPLFEVYLPLDLLQLLFFVSNALLQLLLIAEDILVLELEFLDSLGHQISGLWLYHVFGGFKEHVAC